MPEPTPPKKRQTFITTLDPDTVAKLERLSRCQDRSRGRVLDRMVRDAKEEDGE